jgi:acyl-CoA thioester hydrolase
MQPLLTYRGAVYTWHCDHLGHMNNMWYAGKFDEASWVLLGQIGLGGSYIRESNCSLAAVEQVTTFKRELLAGDSLEVHSCVLEVRDRVVRLHHEMRNTETGEICATLAITAVHMDLNLRRAPPIPDIQRRMAQDLVMPLAEAA